MKLNRFFTRLVSALFGSGEAAQGKPLSPAQQTRAKRQLMSQPTVLAEAQRAGNARRIAAWKRSCEQGYEVKIAKALRPGSRHTTEGIPRWWQEGHDCPPAFPIHD